MGGRVLITRPEPGAARTAERLRTLGFVPVRLPLTEICPTAAELPLGHIFDAVAVSSANAIRHARPSLLRTLSGLPVFAVGRRTAEAAAKTGLANPTTGPGDGQRLATLMTDRLPRGARVAYLCGRVRAYGFEETLRGAGIEATPVETYDTIVLDYTDAELETAPGGEAFDAVLLYSRIAANAFSLLTDRSVMPLLLARTAFVCMSERVAGPVIPAWGARVRIAGGLNEEAMLARLAG
jgi:uroporphyrinogen-III synthase